MKCKDCPNDLGYVAGMHWPPYVATCGLGKKQAISKKGELYNRKCKKGQYDYVGKVVLPKGVDSDTTTMTLPVYEGDKKFKTVIYDIDSVSNFKVLSFGAALDNPWLHIDYEYRRFFTYRNNSLKNFEYELVIRIVREEGEIFSNLVETTFYVGDRCMEDYSDILFTKEDGTPLEFKHEGNGYFVVKFVFDEDKETNENVFYAYYGKRNKSTNIQEES